LQLLIGFALLDPRLAVDGGERNVGLLVAYDEVRNVPSFGVLVPAGLLPHLVLVRVLQHNVDHLVAELKVLLLISDYVHQFRLLLIRVALEILQLQGLLLVLRLQLLYFLLQILDVLRLFRNLEQAFFFIFPFLFKLFPLKFAFLFQLELLLAMLFKLRLLRRIHLDIVILAHKTLLHRLNSLLQLFLLLSLPLKLFLFLY
jgi:hypothetical protein